MLAPRSEIWALQEFTPEALRAVVPEARLTEARKIVSAVHRHNLERPVEHVRRGILSEVRTRGSVPSLETRAVQRSAIDPFVKYALTTADGHVIETVRIPLEQPGRFSVCVSSQVGCALACMYCATGRMGLVRNLDAWEIVEQVRVVQRGLRDGPVAAEGRVHGVVFQGMGEPLANLERVLRAIAVLTDPCAMSIDGRRITVCTSGLPAGIRTLAARAPQVRLGLSLGSPREAARRRLMPITETHSLTDVMDACADHATTTGIAPMWAMTLLAGNNDSDADADALAELYQRFVSKTGIRPRLTLVPYNSIARDGEADPFARVDKGAEDAFRDALRTRGVYSHLRYSGGGDVSAACGQLSSRVARRGGGIGRPQT